MIELILAEFGDNINLEPTLSSFLKYFPTAKVTLYTDSQEDIMTLGGLSSSECKRVGMNFIDNPFAGQDRAGNRANDYFKVKGLLESKSEVAIALDADMRIVSDDVFSLIPLAKRFGLCLPANPRNMVKIDQAVGADVDPEQDDSCGAGHAVNMSPIVFNTDNHELRVVLIRYMDEMAQTPRRGPLVMWRAIWSSEEMPCILPQNFCVCKEAIGIKNPVILHEGHPEVKEYYGK